MSSNKEDFIKIVKENIKRDGIDDLLNYLENETDFFEAPASTRYHGSYEGGLLEHSLNVYYAMLDELKFIYCGKDWTSKFSLESATIVSLFHDVCKIGRYKKEFKNVKNQETGCWESKEVYSYDNDYFPMGHGALSMYRIMKYINLTEDEAQALYWHMGAFDTSQYSDTTSLCNAYKMNMLAFALHRADEVATFICENEKYTPVKDQD